jgi:carotenoid cleavage dioxygenase-like enzyme
MPKAYVQGFTTQPKEIDLPNLPIIGTLPTWLNGTLVRNGPGQFEVGNQTYRHWFDGLAMLHSFSFQDGQVRYRNRYLRSNAYHKDNATGKVNFQGFAVDPCRSLFSRVMSMFWQPEDGNNTVVNVTQLAQHYIAMTETPMAVEFDPRTLETLGVMPYQDNFDSQIATAHPHYDYERRVGLNHSTKFGATTFYQLYAMTEKERRIIASIPVKQTSYIHSFGTTEKYLVLAEFSLRLPNALSLAMRNKPFIENFQWQPETDSNFYVVDKDSGNVVAQIAADAFFAFHHINAYEDGANIIVDISAYADAALIGHLYLDALHDPVGGHPVIGEFRRYTLPLKGGRATYERITTETIELPRINYKQHNGRDYQYVYGGSVKHGTQDFLNQLVKVDVKNRTAVCWYESGCYPGEPVFVPAPNAQAEDEGVILSVVLDSRQNTSFMLVLDAATFTELARAAVPQHVPFGFHGQFFSGV